jgi:benzylsuccinate CoA-transferase BbsF subunit
MIDYFATGRVLGPSANRSERYAPHGAYQCADLDGHERWIAIAVANDDEWESMLKVLGHGPEPAFATMIQRMQQREALDRLIGDLVRKRNADDLTNELQAAGVAAYPVQNCLDIHRDENLEAFGFWHWLDHQAMGPSPYQGLEHRMSRTPGALRSPAPMIGQHNDEVFKEILGMSANEIEELKREKVIY